MRSTSPLDKEYLHDTTRSSSPSPFHFLYPIMPSPSSTPSSSSSTPPHNPHHHSLSSSHHSPGGKGKRHTRRKEREAQEIARLLDPSYQGATLQSAKKDGHRRSLEAYIDMDGDLHDPDFRYFPAAETFVSQTRRDAMDRGRRSSGGGPASPIKRRPHWELDNEPTFLSDEEEEEEILARELGSTDFLTQAGHGNGTSASESSAMLRSRRNNRRDGSFSSYGFGYSGYSSSTTHNHSLSYYSPTMTNSILPTSYDSENTLLTNADVDPEKEKGLLKRRRRGEKEKEHTVTAMLLEATREEEKEDHHHHYHHQGQRPEEDEEEDAPIEQPDYVPTCTEALKRHWLSISLKFRFGVYRSQRRFMRRVNSLF